MIVDSHQHFWQVGKFDYPWMSPDLGVLFCDYGPSDLEPILKRCGVEKTVLVQASNTIAETHWLLELAADQAFIAGVVGWVDLRDAELERELETLIANPKFKGVRHLVESEPSEDWLVQPNVLRGLQVLGARGLSYDLLVHTRHLKYARTVAESCPELQLVIDHMAKPPIRSAEINEWAQELKATAIYPNVHCKLSGLVTEADLASWRPDDLRPFVDRAFEYFGPGRMMFGSDWPVCLLAASYEQVLETSQLLLEGFSETDRNAVLGNNAVGFYRLESVADNVKHEEKARSSEFSL